MNNIEAPMSAQIVLFGTPRGGFQAHERKIQNLGDTPWSSQASLQRFYKSGTSRDASKDGWLMQVVRSINRFEVYYVLYDIVDAAQNGRSGGCLGFAVFSSHGFPKDLLKTKKEVFDVTIKIFLKAGILLTRDANSRICFAIHSFDRVVDHIDSALDSISEEISKAIDPIGWEGTAVFGGTRLSVISLDTSPDVIRDVLRRTGGVVFSERGRCLASLEEFLGTSGDKPREVGIPIALSSVEGVGDRVRDLYGALSAVASRLEAISRELQKSLHELKEAEGLLVGVASEVKAATDGLKRQDSPKEDEDDKRGVGARVDGMESTKILRDESARKGGSVGSLAGSFLILIVLMLAIIVIFGFVYLMGPK